VTARFDNVGLWWSDYPVEKVKGVRTESVRAVEPPHTGWTPPLDFPNLAGVRRIGLDTETKDLELLDRGPGAVRGAAHVVGISIAVPEKSWYFPLRHEYAAQAAFNQDPGKVFSWLQGVLTDSRCEIVGANLLYDLENLRVEGVTTKKNKLIDVQYAEPLLDEEARSYALELLAQKHLTQGKESPLLYKWCADSFGGEANPKQRANIWRAPPSLVGPYAESDALLPLQIYEKQRLLLQGEGLFDLFRLECDLIPLLLDMRFRGVRVNVLAAEALAAELRMKARMAQGAIPGVDVWSNESIARAFDQVGEEFVRTEAGNPSFTKEWLEQCPHPLAAAVLDVRLYEKAINPFIESYILGNQYQGRVHCQFHPLRSAEYGAVTGRFSSSNPNLQNIPARHPVIAPLLRALFIPEEGCRWRRADHSQIEYRLLISDAVGASDQSRRVAEELRARYNQDPDTDFHEAAIQMVHKYTGITLGRRPAKNLNFGLVYGMGRDKLIRSLGVSADVGTRLYEAYFEALPCIKDTLQSASRLAARRGYIKTLLGRRRRFSRMEEGFYGGQQRAGTHKALNARLQGGAADVMKKGMVDCYQAGVFDATGIPHLTVHDELDWSDDQSPRAAEGFKEAKHLLENCVKLKVPLLVKMDEGENWGTCL
jgi:DNA polymerase I-like protein with 3'-5' exonuclease and polymerase domains